MPLASLRLGGCDRLEDESLGHLRGMPITDLDIALCVSLTSGAMEHVRNLPLTSLEISENQKLLNDETVQALRGMHLRELGIGGTDELTDIGLQVLKVGKGRLGYGGLHVGEMSQADSWSMLLIVRFLC